MNMLKMDGPSLLQAYANGLFPMAMDETGRIGWFSPDPRALIPLDDRFHIPRGLRRRLRQHPFQITLNRAFPAVIRACATRHGDTWISEEIMRAYHLLHQQGNAHSVEVWQEDRLVGGLYGVQLGAAFFGESMFHIATDASKIALVHLVERLREQSFLLLDTQWQTRHLKQFGTYTIPRIEYLEQLRRAVATPCRFLS